MCSEFIKEPDTQTPLHKIKGQIFTETVAIDSANRPHMVPTSVPAELEATCLLADFQADVHARRKTGGWFTTNGRLADATIVMTRRSSLQTDRQHTSYTRDGHALWLNTSAPSQMPDIGFRGKPT